MTNVPIPKFAQCADSLFESGTSHIAADAERN